MTFGIDISAGQVGMDMARAKREGVEFVIVKAVAAWQPAHSVAQGYHRNVDATLAAGIRGLGHYLVPNSRNTPEASARFMAANLHRYKPGQVLALDNEPLDTYAIYWRDAQCARFFRELRRLTKTPYEQMWLYCPASLTRQHAPWPECEALGVRFWWSAYGRYPTGHTPDHSPALNGSLSHWDIHQFSSRSQVAGMAVDGNHSPHSAATLFKVPGPSGEEEDDMYTPEDRKRDEETNRAAQWSKTRLGGSALEGRPSITEVLRGLTAATKKIAQRVGGGVTDPTLAKELDEIQQQLQQLLDDAPPEGEEQAP